MVARVSRPATDYNIVVRPWESGSCPCILCHFPIHGLKILHMHIYTVYCMYFFVPTAWKVRVGQADLGDNSFSSPVDEKLLPGI